MARRGRRTRYTEPWRRIPPGIWARQRGDGAIDALIDGTVMTMPIQAWAPAPSHRPGA